MKFGNLGKGNGILWGRKQKKAIYKFHCKRSAQGYCVKKKLKKNQAAPENEGYVRLGNLDLDFKIRISDLQSNAKSENRFQRCNICFWIFLFTVRLENPKKDLKNCP